MNKNTYKLIFSKAKAMFIAVGENVRGYNHHSSTKKQIPSTSPTIAEYDQQFKNSKTIKFTTLALSLWTAVTPILPNLAHAQSQIQPYAQGHADYRPTLLRSDNNIPIVNIRSVNEAGVSRNQFGQFDIDEKGVVLNNARFATASQLAGRIEGNFWLLSGEAKTIVNEIYNPNPTQLNGKIEVAGQTANIIIANPSGLTINGGGFINANNNVLTTGRIDYHQGVPVGVQVDQGTIKILDQGLSYQHNGKNTPYFAQLFSETATIHGQITGSEDSLVQVVTGQNAIGLSNTINTTDIKPKNTPNTSSSTSQHISVDIGQMGQVYAGGIHIVSTHDGMGVKQAGQLKANQFMTLQADGKIINSGEIKTTAEHSQIVIKNSHENANIDNTGSIHSSGSVLLTSANDINNSGKLLGEQQTTLVAQNTIDFNKIDYQNTKTDLTLQAGNSIKSQQNIHIDTMGDIHLKAGKTLNLDHAHIQSRNTQVANMGKAGQSEQRNIEIIAQDLSLQHSRIEHQAGEIYIGAKDLIAHDNQIHSHSAEQNAAVQVFADHLTLTENTIKSTNNLGLY